MVPATLRALRAEAVLGLHSTLSQGLGTQPAALVTASGATVPTQQPASHGPNGSLCLPTGAHKGGEWGGGQPIAQGQEPLHIWGLLRENFPQGPTLLSAFLGAPSTWAVGCELQSWVLRSRPAHTQLSTRREVRSFQLHGPGHPLVGAVKRAGQGWPWKYSNGNRSKLVVVWGLELTLFWRFSSNIYIKLQIYI